MNPLRIFFATLILMLFMIRPTFAASTIEITGERATSSYWITPDGDQLLLTPAQIRHLNYHMRTRDPYAESLRRMPPQLSANAVQNKLNRSSKDNDYIVNAPVKVQYAVTVRRTNVRQLPQPWDGDKYDGLQGTALDPAEAVAVLIPSRDEKFFFCQTRNYFGWIDRNDLAFTDQVTWLSYAAPKDFLVVVDHKKTVDVKGSKLLFQMGALIPLMQVSLEEVPEPEDNSGLDFTGAMVSIGIPAFPRPITNHVENTAWIARLPISVNGRLKEVYITIADDDSINHGWLPCTQNNFVRQAFKFLGDEYGWGGLNNSVDCSAFVNDVYRSMGIQIPRDADKQEGSMPIFAVFNNVDTHERYEIVKRAPLGSLLFKRGHVMMYLGQDKRGTPLVIHSVSSYVKNGEKIFIRKVIVSDLRYQGKAGVETIDQLTGIASVPNGG